MDFDLSAFDLDGTILDRELGISDRTFAALERLREYGLRTVVATGRRYESAREQAARLGFFGEDPIVCYGGSMVRRMNGETLLHHTMDNELAVEALQWAEDRGLAARIFLDNAIVVAAGTPEAFGHVRMSGEPEVLTVESLADWLKERGVEVEEPTKVVIVDGPERIDGWLEEARAVFEGRLFVTRSLPHYVEISTPKGTKSNALEFLCGEWGIEPSRVMAFGDADNDIDMLRFVGHGVAVGGMNDEVRAAADAVTSPVDEDGVAKYVEKILGDL
ncbi:MAG: Cof-type HAD-IIB family hydrolase [Actinomycetota bacterium]|nr:Cof-type HAD-IIB family hydrolase [Actinomycetota bacterium]